MKRFSLPHYIIFGMLGWGIPAVLVAGPEAAVLTLIAVLPVWWINQKPVTGPEVSVPLRSLTCAALVGVSLLYILYDNIFGRHNLSYNLLLFGHTAFENNVEYGNQHISEGRNFPLLLGAIMHFLPFYMADRVHSARRIWRYLIWGAIALLVFNETGAGRMYLMVAILAFVVGRSAKLRQVGVAGCALAICYLLVSYLRGDFDNPVLDMYRFPLIADVAFPYINLSLMLNQGCAVGGNWYGYVLELAKKFLPAFLVQKTVFSFNIEMSQCIYPFEPVESVSIFTYLGEFFYYQPPYITALIAGVVIAAMAALTNHFLLKYNLLTTRIFIGVISIGLLRSRSQDLISYLLAFLIFLLLVCPFVNLLQILRLEPQVLDEQAVRAQGQSSCSDG